MNRTKNKLVLILFTGLILISLSSLLNAQDKSKDELINKLNKELKKQESITENQKKEIDSLKAELKKFKTKQPFQLLPEPLDKHKLPKGAAPFKFNGQTYYVVPIESKNEIKKDRD